MLSQTDIERYRADGTVVPDYRVPEEVLGEIRAGHDRLIAKHPEFEDYCPALLAFDAWFLNVLERGQVSLHDVFLAHGSEPNRSDRPRRGMTLRYMPTTSFYDRDFAARQRNAPQPTPSAPPVARPSSSSREQTTLVADAPPSRLLPGRLRHGRLDKTERTLFLMRGEDRSGGRNDYRVRH